jgi:LysR family nitrogen assimilation transcriptional regulator
LRREVAHSRLRHLHYFVSVIDAGSISRAAETIHVAQPAISQQIAELERDLGMPLMVRSVRGIMPTPAGKTLYREAQHILRRMERLTSILSSEQDVEGIVSLGISSEFADLIAVPFIKALSERFPRIKLRISVGDCETIKSRLASGKIDLACIFENQQSTRFERRSLFRHRLYFLSGRRGANDCRDVSLDRVAAEPLILPPAPSALRELLERAFAREQAEIQLAAEAGQGPISLAAVRNGLGATIAAKTHPGFEASLDGLSEPRPLDPPLVLTSAVLWSQDSPLSAADSVVRDLLVEHFISLIGKDGTNGIERVDSGLPGRAVQG